MTRIVIVVLAAMLALSACGRKGPLEAPPDASGPVIDTNENDQQYEPEPQ